MLNQFDAKLIFAIFGFAFALISFLYKNHETNQLRILKNITDNIKEINKVCIEVFANQNMKEDVYPRISMFLDLVQLDVKTFPTGKFYNSKKRIEANRDLINRLIEDYKDLIFSDTPIENKSIKIEIFPNREEKLDDIIQKSIKLLDSLEKFLP